MARLEVCIKNLKMRGNCMVGLRGSKNQGWEKEVKLRPLEPHLVVVIIQWYHCNRDHRSGNGRHHACNRDHYTCNVNGNHHTCNSYRHSFDGFSSSMCWYIIMVMHVSVIITEAMVIITCMMIHQHIYDDRCANTHMMITHHNNDDNLQYKYDDPCYDDPR